ncbi:hypothetical protein [Deinococcus sp. PESE-13]
MKKLMLALAAALLTGCTSTVAPKPREAHSRSTRAWTTRTRST